MRHQFTRQELYELVWSEPASKLGPQLGISGVGLAKACRRGDIPVPERGYWARLQAGKPVVKRPLPPRGLGMPDSLVVGESSYESYEALRARILSEPIAPPVTFSETLEQVTERVRKLVGKVHVARTLNRPHPLVARLLEEDARRQERRVNSSFVLSTDAPLFETPIERRRLRILNAIFLAVQRSGCRPWLRDKAAHDIGLLVGERNVGFSLECVVQRQRAGGRAKNGGKGTKRAKIKLAIPAARGASASEASWQDTDGRQIEAQLNEAVVALIAAGEAQHRAAVQASREWFIERKAELELEERQRRAEEDRRERERLAKLEQERIDRLFNAANDWRRAGDLRAFVEAVRDANRDLSAPDAIERLRDWADDALAAADRLDPLRGGGLRFD